MNPQRIQLRRTKGWRKPVGAVCVDRSTAYGNPYRVDAPHPVHGFPMSAQEAVDLFERDLVAAIARKDPVTSVRLNHLKGHDLGCWCALDCPCHGNVWLKYANA